MRVDACSIEEGMLWSPSCRDSSTRPEHVRAQSTLQPVPSRYRSRFGIAERERGRWRITVLRLCPSRDVTSSFHAAAARCCHLPGEAYYRRVEVGKTESRKAAAPQLPAAAPCSLVPPPSPSRIEEWQLQQSQLLVKLLHTG